MTDKTKTNEKTWDSVSDLFVGGSALPSWGPFSVGKKLHLISAINGKTFLEIGCGSGRSIKYLVNRGAAKVYGLDFSKVQILEARRFNQAGVKRGIVQLFQTPMEQKLNLSPVDIVFSVYAIGWTQNPQVTFANIYSYLKPGGQFIWSWDHSFFTDVHYEDNKFVVHHSYHDEKPLAIKDWKKPGTIAHLVYRKTSTWFNYLTQAGFSVTAYYEPEPEDLSRGHKDPHKYYSIQKARLVPSSFIFVCQKSLT